MTETYTSIKQSLINKINAKQDFNYAKQTTNNEGRYTVSIKTLHNSMNPSIHFRDCYKVIDSALEEISEHTNADNALEHVNLHVVSLGGWLDQNTNIYYVDLCVRYHDLGFAINVAMHNNEIAIYDNKTDSLIHI